MLFQNNIPLKKKKVSSMTRNYPQKQINMEPENDAFQKESPFPGQKKSGSMLNFRGLMGTGIHSILHLNF